MLGLIREDGGAQRLLYPESWDERVGKMNLGRVKGGLVLEVGCRTVARRIFQTVGERVCLHLRRRTQKKRMKGTGSSAACR